MLDERVAHGKARTSIAELSPSGYASSGALQHYYQMVKSGGEAETVKGARRKLREFLPLMRRHWMMLHEGEDKKYGPYLSGLSLEAFVKGERYFGYSPSPDTFMFLMQYRFGFMRGIKHFNIGAPLALFGLHAIARNHQRDEFRSKAELAEDLLSAIPSMWLMRYVCSIRPDIKQVFAKTSGGLYIGAPSGDPEWNALVFKTFVNLDNLQPKFRAAMCSLIDVDLVRFEMRAYSELVEGVPAVLTSEEKDRIAAVFDAPEMAWMRGAYEPQKTAEKTTSQITAKADATA